MNTTPLPPRPKKAERDAAREAVTEASTRACDVMRRAAEAREALKAAEAVEEQEKRALRTAQVAEERLKHIDRLHALPPELVEVLARAARRERLALTDGEWKPLTRRALAQKASRWRSSSEERLRYSWTADGSALITILREWFERSDVR